MDEELKKMLTEIQSELERLSRLPVIVWADSGRLSVGIEAMRIGLAIKDYEKRQGADVAG